MPHHAESVGRVAWAVALLLLAAFSLVSRAEVAGGGPFLANPSASTSAKNSVRVSVFSLFHPVELRLKPQKGAVLALEVGGQHLSLSGNAEAVLVPGELAGESRLQLRIVPENTKAGGRPTQEFAAPEMSASGLRLIAHGQLTATGLGGFRLEVPGKLRREFTGTLEIRVRGQVLEAVVIMPLETAVASIVQAESPPLAPLEALKAQAIAARSFLVARQTTHRAANQDFDFCDTTHCQFLRSPPALDSPAAQATTATTGLVLTFQEPGTAQDQTLPAMYARSCGGRTRTLRQIGVRTPAGYPYYSVRCRYCASHPELWREPTSPLHPNTEADRLNWNRIHGWGAIPSLNGRGVGHGVGLCQLGAAEMARNGAKFAGILAHYYPNTRLTEFPTR